MLCERQSENTQQLSTYSVAYPDAATTLIDTFSEHTGIKYSERESPFLGYLETISYVERYQRLFCNRDILRQLHSPHSETQSSSQILRVNLSSKIYHKRTHVAWVLWFVCRQETAQ